MQKQEPYWVKAAEVKRLTGWSDIQLFRQRKLNPKIYTTHGKGYKYDLSKIPKELLKQTA